MATWNRIDWPVEKMREWYEKEGLSLSQIGAKLGRSGKLILKVAKKHGFQMRPVGCPGGKQHPCWKGGRSIDKSGYVLTYAPDHPFASSTGRVREHRLVVEKHLGRYLTRTEVVHHINDDPSDNRLDNLLLYETNGLHLAETLKGKRPNWSAEGVRRIKEGNARKRRRTRTGIRKPSKSDD